jgi:hypothetical protein
MSPAIAAPRAPKPPDPSAGVEIVSDERSIAA